MPAPVPFVSRFASGGASVADGRGRSRSRPGGKGNGDADKGTGKGNHDSTDGKDTGKGTDKGTGKGKDTGKGINDSTEDKATGKGVGNGVGVGGKGSDPGKWHRLPSFMHDVRFGSDVTLADLVHSPPPRPPRRVRRRGDDLEGDSSDSNLPMVPSDTLSSSSGDDYAGGKGTGKGVKGVNGTTCGDKGSTFNGKGGKGKSKGNDDDDDVPNPYDGLVHLVHDGDDDVPNPYDDDGGDKCSKCSTQSLDSAWESAFRVGENENSSDGEVVKRSGPSGGPVTSHSPEWTAPSTPPEAFIRPHGISVLFPGVWPDSSLVIPPPPEIPEITIEEVN